ncbi:hypothetical protein Daesc_001988 [Daldinia eschscholtzii]|uniref:3beta-hydroxysteroid 3-dehydrogenase n=1 Tax=Daldinia eschscholtzii TaxID=292717 RepID=A0AAX6MVR8_9PEZI
MAGSILITGANGTLAIPAVEYLLKKYPDYTALLTVRDSSDADPNTNKLRGVISRYSEAKAFIYKLDLTSLSHTHQFASKLSQDIQTKQIPPLKSILCNACYWDLVSDSELTEDGYDKTFQINHISQVALVLRLLNAFAPDGGRIVLFSSEAHSPGRAILERIPPTIPDDLNLLIRPAVHTDKAAGGFHRYLEKDENLRNITAVAYNPGGLVDSRLFDKNTSRPLNLLMRYVVQPLLPLVHYANPQMRLGAESGVDAIELALDHVCPGERGYFELLEKDESSAESRDKAKQERLWAQSAEWANINKENTALRSAFK